MKLYKILLLSLYGFNICLSMESDVSTDSLIDFQNVQLLRPIQPAPIAHSCLPVLSPSLFQKKSQRQGLQNYGTTEEIHEETINTEKPADSWCNRACSLFPWGWTLCFCCCMDKNGHPIIVKKCLRPCLDTEEECNSSGYQLCAYWGCGLGTLLSIALAATFGYIH